MQQRHSENHYLNSILLNSEVRYNVTKANIYELEKIDNILHRKILNCISTTPVVLMHLDLATLPIRYIVMTRRAMFLQYILKQSEDSLLYKFLLAQINVSYPGDWWVQMKDDLSSLNINLTLSEIKELGTDLFPKVGKILTFSKREGVPPPPPTS